MPASSLLRWSGLSFVLGGLLTSVPVLFHPPDDASSMATTTWTVVHILIGLGIALVLLGLVGSYVRQYQETGSLGLAGFVLAFLGLVFFSGALLFAEAYVLPQLASNPATASLIDPMGPLFAGPLGITFLVIGAGFTLGMFMYGLATWMAGVFPRWSGLFLIAGAPLVSFTPPLPLLAAQIGAVLLGIGSIWIGYSLWTYRAEEAEREFRQAA